MPKKSEKSGEKEPVYGVVPAAEEEMDGAVQDDMVEDEDKAPKKPSAEVLERALARVKEERTLVRSLTTTLRNQWVRYYGLYRKFRDPGASTYNRVFIPKVFEQIERIAPRLTAHDPVYNLIPLSNSAIHYTEVAAEWLMYVWSVKNLRRETRLWVKAGLIYGTSFVKMDIERVTMKNTITRDLDSVDEATGQPMQETVTEIVEVSALPKFGHVDILDIDIDPRVSCIEEANGIIHNIEKVKFSDLLRDKEDLGYFNLDVIKEASEGGEGPGVFDNSEKHEKEVMRGVSGANGDALRDEKRPDLENLVVREYWGVFSPTGDAEDLDEYVITVVNDKWVIRCEKNIYASETCPYGVRPFEIFTDHDVPGELYGIGEIEPTETLQIGINKMRNQRLDNVDLVLNRMWIMDRSAGINPKSLVSIPGNVIPADDIEGVKPLATPDVTSSAYAEEDRFSRDFQNATGTIDPTDRGGSSGFVSTATGQKIRDKESSARFQLKIENLEDALSRVGQKMLKMILALGEDSYRIRRQTKDGSHKFTDVNRKALEEIVSGLHVKVKGGSTISDNQDERRENAMVQWNMAKAAFDAGVIAKDELKSVYNEAMMVSFGSQNLSKPKGGGLDVLLPLKAKVGKVIDRQINEALLNGGPLPQMPGQGAPGPSGRVGVQGGGSVGGGQLNPQTMGLNGLTPGTFG